MATGLATIGSAASSSMRKPCRVSNVFSASAGGVGGTDGNFSGSAQIAASGRNAARAIERLRTEKALGVGLGDGVELGIGQFGFPEFEFRGFEVKDGRVRTETEPLHREFLERDLEAGDAFDHGHVQIDAGLLQC